MSYFDCVVDIGILSCCAQSWMVLSNCRVCAVSSNKVQITVVICYASLVNREVRNEM